MPTGKVLQKFKKKRATILTIQNKLFVKTDYEEVQ